MFMSSLLAAVLVQLTAYCALLAPFDLYPTPVQKKVAKVCKVIKGFTWPWAFLCCPWVSIRIENKHLMDKMSDGRTRGILLIGNHTSWLDSVVLCVAGSSKLLAMHTVLASSYLLKTPLIGQIMKSERHIPVHFAGSKQNDFSLEEDKRKAMEDRMDEALQDKDMLFSYPEGQVNRDDTKVLNPFRYGTFRCAIKNDASIWGWVAINNDLCWPDKGLPGQPAEIVCTLLELAPDGALAFLRQNDVPLVPREGQTEKELMSEQCKFLAQEMQKRMQAQLDALHSGSRTKSD